MLTQEYEGRGVDVTIMPWVGGELPRTATFGTYVPPFPQVGHTNAMSALMSAIKVCNAITFCCSRHLTLMDSFLLSFLVEPDPGRLQRSGSRRREEHVAVHPSN